MTRHYPILVPLHAHTVALNLLLYLIDQADRGLPNSLLSFMEPGEIDDLRNLPVKDLLRTTDQGQAIIHVLVDTHQLRLCLKRLRNRDDSDADKLWFVRRGAPSILMRELFGMSERDFREMRRIVGMSAKSGRPPAMNADIENQIVECWRAFSSNTTLVQRYRVTGEKFNELSFSSIYSLMNDSQL